MGRVATGRVWRPSASSARGTGRRTDATERTIASCSPRDNDGLVIPKTRWATTVDGADIAYQEIGKGPLTLVVIHGWISHLDLYWEQPRFVRFMRRLSAQMRVLHFDKRGTGMSDRFARVPDLETRMDDLRAVMDAAGVERAALLGWGFGGPPSALFFAATQPDRTIAVCTTRRSSLAVPRDTPGAMTRPRTSAL